MSCGVLSRGGHGCAGMSSSRLGSCVSGLAVGGGSGEGSVANVSRIRRSLRGVVRDWSGELEFDVSVSESEGS